MLNKASADYCRLIDKQRAGFIAFLIFHLSEVSRSAYPEAGNGEKRSILAMKACNEMIQIASKQLYKRLGYPGEAYPEDAFLSVLDECAERVGCTAGLEWSLKKAFEDIA